MGGIRALLLGGIRHGNRLLVVGRSRHRRIRLLLVHRTGRRGLHIRRHHHDLREGLRVRLVSCQEDWFAWVRPGNV